MPLLDPSRSAIADAHNSNLHQDGQHHRSRDSYSSIETLTHSPKPLQNASRSSSSGFSTASSSGHSTPHERAPIIAGTPPRNYHSTENVNNHPFALDGQRQESPQRVQIQRSKSPADSMGSHMAFGERLPWYKRIVEKYGSLELDNKGSVARDHLALERTFLAWLRTSLAFASIGIAITQLFRLNTSILQQSPTSSKHHPPPVISDEYKSNIYKSFSDADEGQRLRRMGKPLGATFIGVAIVVLIIGFHRYFQGQYWVVRGKFPASRGSVAIIAFIAGALMVSSLVVILAIAPGAVEA
ncbi:hypothetical protein LOZ66_003555 [Ophidiomyces ophidiicola]|nr:hypothetical protein LOZ66_003555 [Ophidiomyces ophidiicola]